MTAKTPMILFPPPGGGGAPGTTPGPTTPPGAVQVGQGTYPFTGGDIAYTGNLTFRVSAGSCFINYASVDFAQTDITLDAAHASLDRFDAIVVGDDGIVTKVTGTAAATPALPDVDPLTTCVLTYVSVPATATTLAIVRTNVYLENTEWTSSVSASHVNAASTSNPFAGTKDIEFTAAVANDFVRLTNSSTTPLDDQKQLVLLIRSKASWPNPKSIQATWYSGSTKIGQSVAISNGRFGFDSGITATYQQIVIPMLNFGIPTGSLIDRLELKVVGSGGAIGCYIDNIVLEGTSTVQVAPTPVPASGIVQVTTASLADAATENGTILLGKTSIVEYLEVDRAAWVRLYATSADRTADNARVLGTPADATTNILGEWSFTGAGTTRRLGIIVYNADTPKSGLVYYAIVNKSGSTHTVNAKFTRFPIEQP